MAIPVFLSIYGIGMLNENRKQFLLIFYVWVLACIATLILIDKGNENLWMQRHRTDMLNSFFAVITKFGEWVPISVFGIYLLVKHRSKFYAASMAFLISDLVMVSLKKWINAPRPLACLGNDLLCAPSVVEPLYHHSMPSGHTFTAFFVASLIGLNFNLKIHYQILCLLLAIFVGLSRVYLACHFLEDVFAGSILGVVGGLLSVYLSHKFFENA